MFYKTNFNTFSDDLYCLYFTPQTSKFFLDAIVESESQYLSLSYITSLIPD